MTLIQSIHLGSICTIITSDTRRVSKLFNTNEPFFEDTSKIKNLSKNILFAGGGAEYITDIIYDEFKKRNIKSLSDAADCMFEIEESIEEIVRDYLKDDWYAQVLIAGFDDDNTSGYITYNSEREFSKFKIEYLEFFEEKITQHAPKQSAYDSAASVVEDILIKDINEFVPEMIAKFAAIHYEMWKKNNQLVSEIFQYQAIYVHPETNERKIFKGEFNLKESKGKVEVKEVVKNT